MFLSLVLNFSSYATCYYAPCIALAWQGSGSSKGKKEGNYRGGFCEELPEGFPMSAEAIPASSNRDLLLAKAKHISDGDSTSGIIYVRRGKICCATAGGRQE